MVLMVVLAAVRLVFSKPQQLEVRQALLPLQFKVLLVAVLPPLQVHRVQGLVLVAVVLRKRETLKTQTLAVLVVTVLLIVFLVHQLLTLEVVVAAAAATMLKRVALEEQVAAVLAAQ
jgi:succinate dehydrogenase/fumarate reductase cytochrome b subunit